MVLLKELFGGIPTLRFVYEQLGFFHRFLYVYQRVIAIDDHLVGGIPTPLKNIKVSWDYYSQCMENKSHVPNHQPEQYIQKPALFTTETWGLILLLKTFTAKLIIIFNLLK